VTRVELEVTIFPNGAALTPTDIQLPGVTFAVAPALERAAPSFAARIVVEGDDDELQRGVAGHLIALRALSNEMPTASITIVADGEGQLRLEAGSFGADEQEVAELLAPFSNEPSWRLLVSFRIEPDAHRHVVDLVTRAVPTGVLPVVDASATALAIGFAITGDADRVANLVGCLRGAWRQEGSESECLVEVEGDHPMLTVVRTWSEWVELERELRRSPGRQRDTAEPDEPRGRITPLADLPAIPQEVRAVLDAWTLSWIDGDDQILGIVRGAICALPDRVEATGPVGDVRVSAGGALIFETRGRRREVPSPDDEVERRLHGVCDAGAVFTETRGDGEGARTRLLVVTGDGVDEGPELTCVRGIDGTEREAYVLASGSDGVRLFAIEVGGRWGRVDTCPWGHDEIATDLALVGSSRVAVTTERGPRAVLHLIERANLVYTRRIALPCTAPQIVGQSGKSIWITGIAPAPGPRRCDLFRVELPTGRVVIETAELDVPTIDVAVADDDPVAMIATPRAIHVATPTGLRELIELGHGDEVTGMAVFAVGARLGRPTLAIPVAFLRGAGGSSLVLGWERTRIPLDTAGHSPRFAWRSSASASAR
jgi:hypothetical protein